MPYRQWQARRNRRTLSQLCLPFTGYGGTSGRGLQRIHGFHATHGGGPTGRRGQGGDSLELYGTHQGMFMGAAPTGKQVTGSGMAISRVVKGKIVEEWEEWDSL